MSNQLAGAETMKSPSIRVRSDLLDNFDDAVDESDRWENRSDAIRDFMATIAESTPDDVKGRVPPVDDDLAEAYQVLLNLSPEERWIPENRALNILAQQTGVKKEIARQMFVQPLDDMGYVKRESDITGYTAVKALR